ncbi:MAG: DUF1810 domain-containing protein [Gammaproteobacteria bacterium]|nr:DUF1810 domain-containing protein [Rhodocyclaceae bacterium]MBU3908695.1 DUF1810 domain-containing protein [Gammaproteobacteria bacterium]MBU4004723.1 DUF1810 domain-containing protein [Gammaproteobacteria bacterium]MBU4021326.1 DUF1810 domain-containing protein [Gammaproteobacteria bacterium]MBU4096343.1 DUF1810 domain-containing protein [Gammaproteobacteria bacterium]
MNAPDPFALSRFMAAQEGIYAAVLAELRNGRKQTHWMWFVFPQIEGLGSSPMAKRYAIKSREEARQYLLHPVLGARLRECAAALLELQGRSISEIMGFPDDLKLKSSMTLFAVLEGPESVFVRVLDRYFNGEQDAQTHHLLGWIAK